MDFPGRLVWTLAALLLWVTQKRLLLTLNQHLLPGRLFPQLSDLTMFQSGRDDKDLPQLESAPRTFSKVHL